MGRGSGRWLLAVAAPKEVEAVVGGLLGDEAAGRWLVGHRPGPSWVAHELAPRFELVVTGVGKANAAAAVARTFRPERHAGVLSLGIAGALPRQAGGSAAETSLQVGDVVMATFAAYGDEGVQGPGGFKSIGELGFGPMAGICGAGSGLDEERVECAAWEFAGPAGAEVVGARMVRGGVASVSTCSGTDALARAVAERTGAIAEDMEAAAIGFTLARLDGAARFAAVKVISNHTGDGALRTWDLGKSLAVLRACAAGL
jgi:futalosine hydrolase